MATDPWAVRQEIARRFSETYTGWNVWITERTWWATHRTPLPPSALRHGLWTTVTGDTAEELRDALDDQHVRLPGFEHR